MRKFCLASILFLLALSLRCEAETHAFIPGKFQGIILYAPIPMYPNAARSGAMIGATGAYRLTIDQRTGEVSEVGVLKRSGHYQVDGAMVFEFFKWRFKPGTIRQLDIPVSFETRDVNVQLRKAASR
jgi:hypothetical protein